MKASHRSAMPGPVALLLALGALSIGTGAGAQDLPPADQLIARYVEAIGGREANLAVGSLRMTGTLEMPALGIRGNFEMRRAAPNRTFTSATVPGLLEQSSGFDGEVAWDWSNLTGPMILDGEMAAQRREDANELSQVRDPSLVPGRETVALSEVAGEPCWRVRLTWASGRESFDCYSRDSGLLVGTEGTELTTMGAVPYTSRLSEYREFGGIRLPTRIVQVALGQEQVMTVVEVQMNALDPGELDPPAAVRALSEPARE